MQARSVVAERAEFAVEQLHVVRIIHFEMHLRMVVLMLVSQFCEYSGEILTPVDRRLHELLEK